MKRRWIALMLLTAGVDTVTPGPEPTLRQAPSSAQASEDKQDSPNILFIFADDVGRDAVGCYGGESYATPNIDQLAERGLRFEHFYAAPVCHPSRIMVMTGCYPSTVGSPKWGSFPKDEEGTTNAHALKEAGYATAVAGKWQLVLQRKDPDHPQRLGFDESCLFGWHEGPRFWSPHIWQNGKRREGLEDAYGPEVYVEFLVDFMRRHKERPFFAFYSMALCHAVSDDFKPFPPHGPKGRYMTYAEMVADMDVRVGQIVRAVEDLGLAENTLILFATDNGTTYTNYIRHDGKKLHKEDTVFSRVGGREIRGGKGSFSDWGIRVPAIAVWPGKIKAGTTTDVMVDLTDLLPTFAELAGGRPGRERIDGRSFAGLLTGGRHEPREWICVQSRGTTCIRDRDWKLLSNDRLYDLANDADEKKPIKPGSDTPGSAAARRKLQVVMDGILARE